MATAIERDDAITAVTQMVAADRPPTLGSTEIARLVDAAARPDAAGNRVEDHDAPDRTWTPTYDLNAAAARGWELKAAETATRFDLTVDGQALERSQIYDHCMKQADLYRRKTAGTLTRGR